MIEATINSDKQDSISITKNSRGYTWDIKRYYNFDSKNPEEIINQIAEINKKLQEKFGSN